MKGATWARASGSTYRTGKPEQQDQNGYLKGVPTYTPLRTFTLIHIEVDPVKFRPQGILTPEIRVHKDCKPLIVRQEGLNASE